MEPVFIWACAYCGAGGTGDISKVAEAAEGHLRGQDYEAERHVAMHGRATSSVALGERPLVNRSLA
jgi:hypothetical protein